MSSSSSSTFPGKHDKSLPTTAAPYDEANQEALLNKPMTKEDLIAFRTHLNEFLEHSKRWEEAASNYCSSDNLAYGVAFTKATVDNTRALVNARRVNQIQIELWDDLAHMDSSEKADYIKSVLLLFIKSQKHAATDPLTEPLMAFMADEHPEVFGPPPPHSKIEDVD